MRLLSKFVVGGVVGASALVIPAVPAIADQQQLQEIGTVSFERNGNSLTCHVVGRTTWFEDEVDDVTAVHAQTNTDFEPDDQPCDDALLSVHVRLAYVREDGGRGTAESEDETDATVEASFDGFASSAEIVHRADFACDEPSGVCSVSVTTRPK